MTTHRFSPHAILYALAAALGLFVGVGLVSVSSAFFGALVLFVLFNPLYHRIRLWGVGARISAFFIVAITLIGVVAPIAGIGMAVITNGQSIVSDANFWLDRLVNSALPRHYGHWLGLVDVKQSFLNWVQSSGLGVAQNVVRFAGNVGHSVLVIFLMLVCLYYALIHQGAIRDAAYRYWPSYPETLTMMMFQVRRVTVSVMVSTALVAMVQSGILGLTFWVLDIPNVAGLTAMAFVLSVIPFVGSPLIWGAVALVKWMSGAWISAAIVVAVGLLVSMIDNLLRPMFQKRFGELHPLVSLLGVVLGVPIFGFIGLFIGPIALVLMTEVLKVALRVFRAESTLIL